MYPRRYPADHKPRRAVFLLGLTKRLLDAAWRWKDGQTGAMLQCGNRLLGLSHDVGAAKSHGVPPQKVNIKLRCHGCSRALGGRILVKSADPALIIGRVAGDGLTT